MGDEVADTTFTREHRHRYREKVKQCLDVFARMLSEARFDPDRRSIGLEIELNLTEETGDPALANAHVLELIADDDFQTELAQFNIEINIEPRKLERAVFSDLEEAVRRDLNHAEGEDLHIVIDGPERLAVYADTVAPEAACTSVQLHQMVDPARFGAHWNAAQAVAGVQLALAANSPFFLTRELWRETRI